MSTDLITAWRAAWSDSITSFTRQYDLNSGNFSQYIRGKRKTYPKADQAMQAYLKQKEIGETPGNNLKDIVQKVQAQSDLAYVCLVEDHGRASLTTNYQPNYAIYITDPLDSEIGPDVTTFRSHSPANLSRMTAISMLLSYLDLSLANNIKFILILRQQLHPEISAILEEMQRSFLIL